MCLLATGIACAGAAIIGIIDPLVYVIGAAIYTPIDVIIAALRADPEAARRARERLQEDEADEDDDVEDVHVDDEDVEVDGDEQPRRFVRCIECDAKNNATRATCWQCKLGLEVPTAPAPRPRTSKPKRRGAELLAASGMHACKSCGAVVERDLIRCPECRRHFR